VREEVQFDGSSPKDGVVAIECVGAALKAEAPVERNGGVHRAAREYRNGEIVWLHR